jgi:hypothetical protein
MDRIGTAESNPLPMRHLPHVDAFTTPLARSEV